MTGRTIAISVAAVAGLGALALVIVKAAPGPGSGPGSTTDAVTAVKRSPAPFGVSAVITADAITAERTLPNMSFRLEPGQSLHPRVPAGPFDATFTIGFAGGNVREARIGARLSGGSVIVRYGSRVIASHHAPPGSEELVLSMDPLPVYGRRTIVYEFRGDGTGPCSLRAVWMPALPDVAAVPLPLPSDGADLVGSIELTGQAAVQRLGCARCHPSGHAMLDEQLLAAAPPDLQRVGERARPTWLRGWIADPAAHRRGSEMPAMLGVSAPAGMVEDLVHYMASLGGPFEADATPADPGDIATGRRLYEQIGCLACHGPLERDDDRVIATTSYVSMGSSAAKTSIGKLAAFLRDPLNVRPSGHMPSLDLDETEARSIAAYVMARTTDASIDDVPFTLDPERVERGRSIFTAARCVSCHELPGVEPPAPARPLGSLADLQGGCLSADATPGLPQYAMNDSTREAIRAFLGSLEQRRCEDVPWDHVALTVDRLRCTACHTYHGVPGPVPEADPYFATLGDADLGEEGRVPPDLRHVGAKLNVPWMRRVLQESARARPYLATRMPRFGPSVDELPAGLGAAAGVAPAPDAGPPFDADHASAGRELVGDTGLNCIQCHEIAGRPATGTPGPDLVGMVERLRFEAFDRWLRDPPLIRPGTRMPAFFVGGRGAFTDYFDGDAEQQIAAMWSYMSQGEMLPLPEGLVDPAGLAIDVVDQPVVFRTFMKSAGVRAIACGFPEQIHCVFDADNCRLAGVWEGQFLNASGAWAARGGSETNPESFAWQAGETPVLEAMDGSAFEARFRGYRLDAGRRPIFMYDMQHGQLELSVQEQPLPKRGESSSMIRRLTITGPPGARLRAHLGGWQRVVTLSGEGAATLEQEITW